MLEQVRNIVPSHVDCVFIRQAEAPGLGHAVACAKPAVNDEPFAVILADDLINFHLSARLVPNGDGNHQQCSKVRCGACRKTENAYGLPCPVNRWIG